MTVKEILAGFLRKINSATGRSDSNLTDAVHAVSQKAEATVTAERTTGTNSVTITPKMTVTKAGFIKDDAAGDPQTVRASDVVSGLKVCTINDYQYDVTNYKYANIAVPVPDIESMNVSYVYIYNVDPYGYGGSADVEIGLDDYIYIPMAGTILLYAGFQDLYGNNRGIFIRYTEYRNEFEVFDGDRVYTHDGYDDIQFETDLKHFRFHIPYNYLYEAGFYNASYQSKCLAYTYT